MPLLSFTVVVARDDINAVMIKIALMIMLWQFRVVILSARQLAVPASTPDTTQSTHNIQITPFFIFHLFELGMWACGGMRTAAGSLSCALLSLCLLPLVHANEVSRRVRQKLNAPVRLLTAARCRALATQS